jgi:tetratricopeptide (TPR) repeat protein
MPKKKAKKKKSAAHSPGRPATPGEQNAPPAEDESASSDTMVGAAAEPTACSERTEQAPSERQYTDESSADGFGADVVAEFTASEKLGCEIGPDRGNPTIGAFSDKSDAPQKGLSVGMVLVSVQGQPMAGLSHREVESALSAAERPLRLGFAAARPFPAGMMVELHGLSATALNGKIGECGRLDETKGRYPVTLLEAGKIVAVRPSNLKFVTSVSSKAQHQAKKDAYGAAELLRSAREGHLSRSELVSKLEQVEDIASKALTQDPQCFVAHQVLGDICIFRDQEVNGSKRTGSQLARESVGHFRRAAENGGAASARVAFGQGLAGLGDREGEYKQLLLAKEQDPEFVHVAYALGLNLMSRGKYEEALREAHCVFEHPDIKGQPGHPLAQATAQYVQRAAYDASNLARELDGGHSGYFTGPKLAFCPVIGDKPVSLLLLTIQILDEARPHLPRSDQLVGYAYRAHSLLALGRYPDALKSAKRALDPTMANVNRQAQSFVYFTIGQCTEAMADVIRATEGVHAASTLYGIAKASFKDAVRSDPMDQASSMRFIAVQAKADTDGAYDFGPPTPSMISDRSGSAVGSTSSRGLFYIAARDRQVTLETATGEEIESRQDGSFPGFAAPASPSTTTVRGGEPLADSGTECAICMDSVGTVNHNCKTCSADAWLICSTCETQIVTLMSGHCPMCRGPYVAPDNRDVFAVVIPPQPFSSREELYALLAQASTFEASQRINLLGSPHEMGEVYEWSRYGASSIIDGGPSKPLGSGHGHIDAGLRSLYKIGEEDSYWVHFDKALVHLSGEHPTMNGRPEHVPTSDDQLGLNPGANALMSGRILGDSLLTGICIVTRQSPSGSRVIAIREICDLIWMRSSGEALTAWNDIRLKRVQATLERLTSGWTDEDQTKWEAQAERHARTAALQLQAEAACESEPEPEADLEISRVYANGTTVTITGVSGCPELNGRVGTVEGFDEAKGR